MTQHPNLEHDKCPVLLLDGGLGTTLSEPSYSIKYTTSTPLWSSHLLLSSPETLFEVHQAFARAGADIILSATYQASFEGFAKTPRLDSVSGNGYSRDEASACMRNAIALIAKASASSSRSSRPAIALSLGAYGAILTPSQEFSGVYPAEMSDEHALASWHKDRLDVFREDPTTWTQIGYVAFETVRPLAEIRGIRRTAFGIRKKWWISHVVPGPVEEASIKDVVVAMLEDADGLGMPWGIGVNCTPVNKVGEVERLHRETICQRFPEVIGKLWFVLYPDGTRGEVYDTQTMSWVNANEGGMVEVWEDVVMYVVESARTSGIWKGIVVGGCCKTLPKDIKTLRGQIDSLLDT